MIKVSIDIDLTNRVATVSKPCDEKYARKLLQDWLKENTLMRGGWQLFKNLEKWNDPEMYYFDIHQIFAFPTDNYSRWYN